MFNAILHFENLDQGDEDAEFPPFNSLHFTQIFLSDLSQIHTEPVTQAEGFIKRGSA